MVKAGSLWGQSGTIQCFQLSLIFVVKAGSLKGQNGTKQYFQLSLIFVVKVGRSLGGQSSTIQCSTMIGLIINN